MGDADSATRAWVIHPNITTRGRGTGGRLAPAPEPEPALEEAVALAGALPGIAVEGAEIVNLARVHPGHLFGTGKIDELKARLEAGEIELVLVDGPVSPVQQRNLEKAWGVKLLDRTGLILEIFSDRARTREGVLQVEMAALSYQRTRLVRAWTHLERQRGGLGFVGGPGETQIEADRRAIDEQLVRLRRQLDKVARTRELHRKARAKVPYPIVALVGYTNAGKSTLFNRLTGSGVLAQDMLFATLDPTMRALRLPDGPEIILSDTVGFISDLPTELVAAFRATLEEVLSADVILHVRDIAHPESEKQARDVDGILDGLGVGTETPRLVLLNKIDLLPAEARDAVQTRAARDPGLFAISAVSGDGIDTLLAALPDVLEGERQEATVDLGFDDGRRRAWLFDKGLVDDERQDEDGFHLDVRWTERQKRAFEKL